MERGSVRHDPAAHRFTLATEDGDAVLAYEPAGDVDGRARVVFTHTVVPEAAGGQGVGSRLVRAALAQARYGLYRSRCARCQPAFRSWKRRRPR